MARLFRRRKTPFLPLEEALLAAVVEELESPSKEKLSAQVAATKYVHRYLEWTEVNLYPRSRKGPRTDFPEESLFRRKSHDDFRFARIRFEVGGKKYTSHLVAVCGRVFSIVTRPSPKRISRKLPRITKVTILVDPDVPLSDAESQRELPQTYLAFISDVGPGQHGDWVVFAPDEVYRTELPSGSYWVLAMMNGIWFAVAREGEATGEVFICETGLDPEPAGPFRRAIGFPQE
jgi:hypothetical protein